MGVHRSAAGKMMKRAFTSSAESRDKIGDDDVGGRELFYCKWLIVMGGEEGRQEFIGSCAGKRRIRHKKPSCSLKKRKTSWI